jgi:hypothetical protein
VGPLPVRVPKPGHTALDLEAKNAIKRGSDRGRKPMIPDQEAEQEA